MPYQILFVSAEYLGYEPSVNDVVLPRSRIGGAGVVLRRLGALALSKSADTGSFDACSRLIAPCFSKASIMGAARKLINCIFFLRSIASTDVAGATFGCGNSGKESKE